MLQQCNAAKYYIDSNVQNSQSFLKNYIINESEIWNQTDKNKTKE